MGSTGDPPVPVGDPPTGTSQAAPRIRPSSLAGDVRPIPSGESPDGTGQWPVLPNSQFPNTLLAKICARFVQNPREIEACLCAGRLVRSLSLIQHLTLVLRTPSPPWGRRLG